MKVDEIKLNVVTYINNLLKQMWDSNNLLDRLKIATVEYWIHQNTWKLDDILNKFVDRNGEIDIREAIDFFSNSIFDANGQFTLNLRDSFKNNALKDYIPDKIVVFTRNDINNIFHIQDDSYTINHINSNNSFRGSE